MYASTRAPAPRARRRNPSRTCSGRSGGRDSRWTPARPPGPQNPPLSICLSSTCRTNHLAPKPQHASNRCSPQGGGTLRPSRGQRLSKVSATRKSVGVLSVAAAVSGASGNSHTSCTAHACSRAERAGHTVRGALGRDPGSVCTFPCKVVDIVRVLSLSGGGAGSVRALNRGSSPHAERQVAPPKECPTAESLSAVVARGVARVRLQLRRGACGGALRVRAFRFCRESMGDAACPISTGGGTRRVHLARRGGGVSQIL